MPHDQHLAPAVGAGDSAPPPTPVVPPRREVVSAYLHLELPELQDGS